VHLVTSLEEMPVQETLDGVAELRRIGLPIGSVIVNLTRMPELDEDDLASALTGTLDTAQIERALKESGLSVEPETIGGLLVEGQQHAERIQLETEQRDRLDEAGAPVVALPYVSDGIDLGALYELADSLCSSGRF
jgi:hypothetical protein